MFAAAVVVAGPDALALTTPSTGAIAAGNYHTVALKSDGTVWAWGHNESGQLGDGTTTHRSSAVQVSGLMGVVAIAAGNYHTVVLKSDGTVWAWGNNESGQLGDGTTIQRASAVQVSGLTGVMTITAGAHHTVALKSDGTVWAWGDNQVGQLGDGTTTQRNNAVEVSIATGGVAVAAGDYHTAALKGDGTVWAWGDNRFGQLGDGSTTRRTTAVQVSGLSSIIAIAAGSNHTAMVKADGTLWAHGNNDKGQLGDGTTLRRKTAVQVSGLSDIVGVSGGGSHTVAVKSDGAVWGCGDNFFGQLWDGTLLVAEPQMTAVQASGLIGVVGLAAGLYHTVALKSDGTILSWGHNDWDTLEVTGSRAAALQVGGLEDIVEISAGSSHSVALNSNGTVWAWGGNERGQLGGGSNTSRAAPAQVSGLNNVVAVAAGHRHTVAVESDGSVWAWGSNSGGQLGMGTAPYSYSPWHVGGALLSDVVQVAAGGRHTVVLKSDGFLWAWGSNENGQLWDGTSTRRNSAVQMHDWFGPVISVAAGESHTVALTSYGQIITDTFLSEDVSFTAVAAGAFHSVGLSGEGKVYTMGRNDWGQLGDGTTTDQEEFTEVNGLSDVVAVSAGQGHTIALKSDGTLMAWGLNSYGQLGDGTTIDRTSPVAVIALTDIVKIAAGRFHSLALKSDGSVWAWGDAREGELGFNPYAPIQSTVRLTPSPDDADQDGIVDAWEIQNFGGLSRTGGDDLDSDGLTDIQEFAFGSDPTQQNTDGDIWSDFADPFPGDYYNEETPVMAKLGGDNQEGAPGEFNVMPFDVAVFDSAGAEPLLNAPVNFSVAQGGGLLATSNTGDPQLFSSLTLRTDAEGTVQAYYKQPTTVGVTSQISATAGTAQVTFTTQSEDGEEQQTPTITWGPPSAITYGTALSAAQLNATASVAGSFSYTPSSGTVLGAGTHTLSVSFTPNDTETYGNATSSTTIAVNKAAPSISWGAPAPITYGQALGVAQLNATASVPGSFSYTPAAGTVLNAGVAQTLSVTFTPSDSANYTVSNSSVTLTVNKATPIITWIAPAAIVYGAPLTVAQLNASASVSGTFNYAPALGTVMNAGLDQPLGVTFTPTDAVNYAVAIASRPLTVTKAPAVVTVGNAFAAFDGSPKAATAVTVPASLPVTFTYNGNATAPSASGNYAVIATVNSPNHQGSGTGTLMISPPLPAGFQAVLSLPEGYRGVTPQWELGTVAAP